MLTRKKMQDKKILTLPQKKKKKNLPSPLFQTKHCQTSHIRRRVDLP